jgi:hypothetical protein
MRAVLACRRTFALRAPFRAGGNPNDSFDGIVYSDNYQYELKLLGSYTIIDRQETYILMRVEHLFEPYTILKALKSYILNDDILGT